MVKRGLGRGLDVLLDTGDDRSNTNGTVETLKIHEIEPNKGQARKYFDQNALNELAESILRHGIVQPLAVRKKENGFYEIIAGERRWRAAKIAGLREVPVVVKEIHDQGASEISLIENLQRENLNPMEEACGYNDLMELYDLTQEEAAKKVGKSRTAVANILRLLKLPQSLQDLVRNGSLSYGGARAMLPLCEVLSEADLLSTTKRVIDNDLSVREIEKLVKSFLEKKETDQTDFTVDNEYYKSLESNASSAFGRKITISRKSNGKGNISIPYSNSEDLEELLKTLCGETIFE